MFKQAMKKNKIEEQIFGQLKDKSINSKVKRYFQKENYILKHLGLSHYLKYRYFKLFA